jgi:hypothetical protein
VPDTEFWRYLEARWELDPARFDHWHSRIGPWLAEEYRLTHDPKTITPPISPPLILVVPTDPPPLTPPLPGGGDPPPPRIYTTSGATPEPSSWILLATSAFAAFVVSRFRRGADCGQRD